MPLKIAFLTPFYDPSVGGIQETVRFAAASLSGKGMNVKVFTSQFLGINQVKKRQWKRSKPLPSFENKDGVEIRRFESGGLTALLLGVVYALSYRFFPAASDFFNAWYLRKRMFGFGAVNEICAFKPDVIFAAPATRFILSMACETARRYGSKLLVHTALHLNDPHTSDFKIVLKLLKSADKVLSNTEAEKKFLVANGFKDDQVTIHGPGIDIEGFFRSSGELTDAKLTGLAEDKKYILYFGRKQEGKGFETLVEAVGILRKNFTDLFAVLAGEETDYSKKILAGGGERPYVINIDSPNSETKRYLMRNARVFSMVSCVDSFGMVYCESWLCKRPVIGADNELMRCVIQDGEDGFLVPYGNAALLADKIRFFLENPEQADRMGSKGFEKMIKMFGEHAWENKLVELISQ